jgi:UDP-3-O-[3-hydroxymyristoyl] glucosamine N-acyltransferase
MAHRYSLAELAKITQAQLLGNPEHCISSVDALDSAGPEDGSFLANSRYQSALKETKAGVICIDPHTERVEGKNFLVSDHPSRTFQMLIETFCASNRACTGFLGHHPTAIVHPTAKIGKNVCIGPYVVIDEEVEIDENTQLLAHVMIGPRVRIGSHCLLYQHVTVRERCSLGHRVIIQPGAVIGSCGFGYATDTAGKHQKLEQLGCVVIEDDVEVGANTTIDRARFKETRIARGTKIDNLVQIGHNVHLGEDNIIVSQTGIAGSSKTGRSVMCGGQVGIVGHIELADGIMIATRGGVSKSLKQAGKYAGSPAIPLNEYNRQQVLLRRIEQYVKRIEALEKMRTPRSSNDE